MLGTQAPTVSVGPKITVCMAFRDGDDFIREAVDSVLAQTSAEWELLLFDDGSSDGGTTYAQELAASDARVRNTRHPGEQNRGLAATRAAGASQARGEYLLFLDHDDRLWGDALERLAAVLDSAARRRRRVCRGALVVRAGRSPEECRPVLSPVAQRDDARAAGAAPDDPARPAPPLRPRHHVPPRRIYRRQHAAAR